MPADESPAHPDSHSRQAKAYLAEALPAGPLGELTLRGRFERNPLETEGPVSIYSFQADFGTEGPQRYFVAVGQTVPNYYPDWSLSPDEMLCLHLGTRFMLVLEVRQVDPPPETDAMEAELRRMLATVNPAAEVKTLRFVAAFRVETRTFSMFRCRFGPEEVYVFGHDCPPGFSRRVDLPPHVAFRIHLGQYLRHELETERKSR